ncbi:MAG: hypothetical protein V8R01_03680 [Bacilli bacterium]
MSTGMTGFNPEKANELQDSLIRIFKECSETIQSGWPTVRNTLQENWIGEDEMSLEEAFVGRINWLYRQASEAVNGVNKCVVTWANNWHDFQKTNKVDNSQSFDIAIDVTEKRVDAVDPITFEARTIAASEDRGIKDGSAGVIKGQISSYVENINSSVKGLYNGIHETAAAAFFGLQQTTAIEEFITKVGDAFAGILTAVKDINEAVDKLTTDVYNESDSSMASGLQGTNIDEEIVSQAVNADMRWN